MYYAALPAGATPSSVQGLEKPHQAVYLQAPFPGTAAAAAPAGFTTATPAGAGPQHTLPPGLRYAPQPAYAVVSQAGYSAISPAAFHSVPAYSGIQALPGAAPTSTTYISAAQYPGMSYPAALASRPGSTPYQAAGTPLIATGFPGPMQAAAIPAQAPVAPQPPRHYQIATYPPGYPLPAGSTVPMPYGAAAFGPPY